MSCQAVLHGLHMFGTCRHVLCLYLIHTALHLLRQICTRQSGCINATLASGTPHAIRYECKGSLGVQYRNALAPCLAHARTLRSLQSFKGITRYDQTSC